MNTIIIIVLVLLVLIVSIFVFMRGSDGAVKTFTACEDRGGSCVSSGEQCSSSGGQIYRLAKCPDKGVCCLPNNI